MYLLQYTYCRTRLFTLHTYSVHLLCNVVYGVPQNHAQLPLHDMQNRYVTLISLYTLPSHWPRHSSTVHTAGWPKVPIGSIPTNLSTKYIHTHEHRHRHRHQSTINHRPSKSLLVTSTSLGHIISTLRVLSHIHQKLLSGGMPDPDICMTYIVGMYSVLRVARCVCTQPANPEEAKTHKQKGTNTR